MTGEPDHLPSAEVVSVKTLFSHCETYEVGTLDRCVNPAGTLGGAPLTNNVTVLLCQEERYGALGPVTGRSRIIAP